MRTTLIYILALGALVAAAVFGLPKLFGSADSSAAGRARSAKPPPPVVVATVARQPFVDSVEALGTVLANESVEITPNRADHVTKIHFRDGQEVEAGELLVEMHAEEERALLAEAKAIRDQRKVRFEQLEELFRRDMTSQRDIDDARAELAGAQARVIGLEATIADRMVRAPFDGTLGLRRVSEGAYLQPSSIITTLDDLSVIKLDFTIPETWVSVVRASMKITARSDAWPSDEFSGEVMMVDTRLDERTRSMTVRARLPNPQRKLLPGMLLKVSVERGEAAVLQVPEEAVIPIGEEHFVFRIDEHDIARRIQITLGRRRVGAVEVLDGLEDGERVVIEGIVRVRPDSPVQVVATRTKS